MLFGRQSLLVLLLYLLYCIRSLFPKRDFNIMRRENVFLSFSNTCSLYIPGFGTKFKFVLRSLKSLYVKDLSVNLITYPKGSVR